MEELRQPQSSQKKPRLYTHVGRRALSKLRAGFLTRAAAASSCARQIYQHSSTPKSLFYIQLSASNGEAICQFQLDSFPIQNPATYTEARYAAGTRP